MTEVKPKEAQVDRASKGRVLQPFLRWAGGKNRLAHRLLPFLPADISNRSYREPFLGGASLFLRVLPAKATLSDANAHLMECFGYVRDKPLDVLKHLESHAKQDSKEHYYNVRDEYNEAKASPAQAARFVYLNKTCFNGIFRVNLKGSFNVPYGYKINPLFPDRDHLLNVSKALCKAKLQALPYETALSEARKGEFIYLDPPYPPLNGTAYFTHYTKDRFGEDDQEQLAKIVRKLDSRGCSILMSNADVPLIRKLYRSFSLKSLAVTRFVTCKTRKHAVRELVITNY